MRRKRSGVTRGSRQCEPAGTLSARCGRCEEKLIPHSWPATGKPGNEPLTEPEINRLRESLRRDRPLGTLSWIAQTAHRLGLDATMRPLGPPRKPQD